jgi:hypothetical protein
MFKPLRALLPVVLSVACAAALAPAARAQSIKSYDITHAMSSVGSGWSNTYSGAITTTGSGLSYTGGGGTLNDGLMPTSSSNNQLFMTSMGTTITLHLNSTYYLSEIDLFGGAFLKNAFPGTLTGATVTVGSLSLALSSVGFGGSCLKGFCDDRLRLTGTALGLLATDTITLSNFRGGNLGYFNLAEVGVIGVLASVPEPATWAMLLAGLATLGWAARRRTR